MRAPALRIAPVLLVLLAAGSARAVPSLAGSYDKTYLDGGSEDGGFAPVNLIVPVTVNEGDFVYLGLGLSPEVADIQIVNDSAGNTYQQVFSLEQSFAPWKFGTMWTVAQSTGTLVITFHVTRFDIFDVHLLIYSGVHPTNPIDHSARGGHASILEMSCDLETTQNDDLLLAFMPSVGGFTSHGLGSPRSTLRGHLVNEQSAGPAGFYQVTAETAAGPWLAQCVALRKAPLVADGGTVDDDGGVIDDDAGTGTGGGDGGVNAGDGGIGSDGGSSDQTGGSTESPLLSSLGCSVTPGAMMPVAILLAFAVRVGYRRRR